jgi:fused signal recognition particle receptor
MKILSRMKVGKLEKAIERYPQRPENYFKLARIYAQAEEWAAAGEVLSRLLEQEIGEKEELKARLELADVLLHQGASDDAREQLSAALELKPKGAEAIQARMLLVRTRFGPEGRPPEDAAARQEALQQLKEVIRSTRPLDPARVEALRLSARLYAAMGQRSQAANRLMELADELEKGGRQQEEQLAATLRELAELCEAGHTDPAVARRTYTRLLAIDENDEGAAAEWHIKLGALARADEDLIGAIEHYEMALRYLGRERSERRVGAQLELADLYLATGREQQAAQEVQRAAKVEDLPANLRYRLEIWLADHALRNGDLDGCAARAAKALELAADDDERRRALEALFASARGKGDHETALQWAEQLMELAETGEHEGRAAEALALTHRELGNLDEAVKHAQVALTLLPPGADRSEMILIQAEHQLLNEEILAALRSYLRICEEYRATDAHARAMKALREIRARLHREGDPHREKLSPEELEELDRLLDAAGGETDLIRRLRAGLAKTQANLVGNIERLLRGRTTFDEEMLEELEEILFTADLGVEATQSVIQAIEEKIGRREALDARKVKELIKEKILELLRPYQGKLRPPSEGPFVIMVVGVNGTGKTTTIAKLAKAFKDEGKEVLLAAGDTFRAGAIEQLQIWGDRVGCEVIKHNPGSDPSGLAYDAVLAASSRGIDCLILDTAGRLHTKRNLMEELKKIHRVVGKNLPGAPHEVLLVVDATTGQNAMNQARIFHEATPITGLVLTKMDGTAKGGIIVRITSEYHIPVKFIGIGEKMDDLRPFDAEDFVNALFG